ncbi:hypothetical protein F5Y18DRAFT_153866 [Xylariaceae sp. FL1019]|nr:hypothetical protein F5Y18DRAFT_153866 [Xylariaceae sp. FL1019]
MLEECVNARVMMQGQRRSKGRQFDVGTARSHQGPRVDAGALICGGLVVSTAAEAALVVVVVPVLVVTRAAEASLVVLVIAIFVVAGATKVALVILVVAVLVVARSAEVLRGGGESEGSHCESLMLLVLVSWELVCKTLVCWWVGSSGCLYRRRDRGSSSYMLLE